MAPGPAPGPGPGPAPPPTVDAASPAPERAFSRIFGGDDLYVDYTDATPMSAAPAIMNDADVVAEEESECCPEGFFCCGLELGCVPDEYAPQVMCPPVGPDSPTPCCL
jgi:hypothetical protein